MQALLLRRRENDVERVCKCCKALTIAAMHTPANQSLALVSCAQRTSIVQCAAPAPG